VLQCVVVLGWSWKGLPFLASFGFNRQKGKEKEGKKRRCFASRVLFVARLEPETCPQETPLGVSC